jgi:hypothetical protein
MRAHAQEGVPPLVVTSCLRVTMGEVRSHGITRPVVRRSASPIACALVSHSRRPLFRREELPVEGSFWEAESEIAFPVLEDVEAVLVGNGRIELFGLVRID